jgi:PKD repeat protein
MRNYLLFLSLLTTGMFANAQQQLSHRDNSRVTKLIERPVVMQNNHSTAAPTHQHRASRSLPSILNSQRIGSAGNLLSIIEGTCNQMDVNDSLNVVTFVHRNDPSIAPGTNVAQYRYDVSKNRGGTWTNDVGPITNDGLIDNVSVNGRFPQGVIYNPAGNTNVDNAYLVYSGTWHDNTTWSGQMRGRGKLSGDTSTFNVHIDPINNKHVSIAAGMCKGAPGVFWNVNVAYTGTFTAGADAITSGIIVQKGVWNSGTNDVDWTNQTINQTFVGSDNAGATVSIATGFNIAFDPTGQKGWIAILGDITADADSVYDPIFWKTIDGGNTWTGPIHVDLDSIQGVRDNLSPTLVNGDPATQNPTTSFDADLSVDVYGNPHLLTTIGSGTEYSIQAAGYGVWDITYDASASGCNWRGVHLADILTLRGTFTNDNPAQTMDNRPLVSRSAEGDKLFFFWEESDATFVGTTDNDVPNFFGRAIDVVQQKITPLYNFTEGDSLWGGETSNPNSGGSVFGGAIFPTVSQTALQNGNTYNIPTVFTQVDYNHDPATGLGSSEQPAAFWYISNINVPASDFNAPLDQVAPSITLNGPDTISILQFGTYTEQGATAFDCTDGVIVPTIQNSPDTAVVGTYDVLYIATDAAGNRDTVVRTVIIGAKPVADFSFSTPVYNNRVQFLDLSTNFPDHWVWSFGDNSGSVQKNPLKTYNTTGTFNVCLTSSNAFGTSTTVCKDVTVTSIQTGINDVELDQQIAMFPNPSNGKVNVTVKGDVTPQLTVTVYNILGETVANPVTYKAGTTNMQLDLSGAASGLYLVKIQSEKASTIKHLTINHK